MWVFGSIFSTIAPPGPSSDGCLTRHELGQHDDYVAGLVPMAVAPETIRVPPPFPLAAYLVMKRAE